MAAQVIFEPSRGPAIQTPRHHVFFAEGTLPQVLLKRKFIIDRLDSGGLITNYYCTSKCRHCLYGCSPSWKREYIDAETTDKNIRKIKSLACRSIHIGGGEPFLNPDGLNTVVETVRALGVHIEYVETNSSWYKDKDSACQLLSSLKARGLSTLLISISPFHNEHIPFYKVKGVIEACRTVNMGAVPWVMDFYGEVDAFDDQEKHSIQEYIDKYGPNYLKELPSRYWIHFGGRALESFSDVLRLKPYEEILFSSRGGCIELGNVSHFHIDLFGNYIPGLCSGLSIHRDDLGHEITSQKYPLLHTLFYRGIAGLFDLVSGEEGFTASERYLSKCHLCLDLRRHLVIERSAEYAELRPIAFYANL